MPESIDIVALARRALSRAPGAGTGELAESRYRRLQPTVGTALRTEVELLAKTDQSATHRVSVFGSNGGQSRKIAEYEETRLVSPPKIEAVAAAQVPGETTVANDQSGATTAELRRRQIFEGACEVIARKGYGDASVREIAKAAGLSIPALYQYVSSKEDILYMITHECMNDLFRTFRDNVRTVMSADRRMETAIAEYVSYISDNRKYINLVYSETRSLGGENREKIFDLERAMLKEWQEIYADGVDSGVFRPLDSMLVANIFYFACSVWALRNWAIGDFEESEVSHTLTEILMRGILNTP